MPIVQAKPLAPEVVKDKIPQIHSTEVSTNVVDTKYTPLSNLITYVEGSKWTVNYYSQVIDNDTALAGQDTGQSGIYQQYRVIRGLDLKVENAIIWSQNPETKQITASGTAHIHSLIIPNNGDMFTADIGDAREGVFQITLSEKKSLFKESVYFVEYQLIYLANDEKNRKADLDSKVVQELFYLKDFLQYGQNPLVSSREFEVIEQLKLKYHELINHYFRWFFSREFNTLLVPGQNTRVYDHFVVQFLLSILDTRDNEYIRYVRRLNVEDDYNLKEPNIWTALATRDLVSLKTGFRKTGLVSTKFFNKNPMMESIRFSGIEYVVYPKDHQVVFDSANNLMNKTISETQLERVNTRTGNLSEIIYDQTITINGNALKSINSVLSDDHYVLSQNFYENLPNKSVLEVLVENYFQEEANDNNVLLNLTNSVHNWGGLERFYYIPLLLALIKNSIRSI